MRFLVVSDVHADTVEGRADTSELAGLARGTRYFRPLEDLLEFAKKGDLHADVMLIAGDLCNKADADGAGHAWGLLRELFDIVGAKHYFATPGNHDRITKHSTAQPYSIMRGLDPTFPSSDATVNADFWSDGVAIFDTDPAWRLLLIDSCRSFPDHPGVATVGVTTAYQTAINRGEFSVKQADVLVSILPGLEPKAINIVLCHHHPFEYQRIRDLQDTYGAMKGGGELLKILETYPDAGRWLVVHGHKHIPDLCVAGSASTSPIVLASGSAAAVLWPPMDTVTLNQVHLVEFHTEVVASLPDSRGVVRSYSWGYGEQWSPAERLQGLPATSGFGVDPNHGVLASSLRDWIEREGLEFAKWRQACEAQPELKYVSAGSFSALKSALKAFGIEVHSDDGEPTVLIRSGDAK